MSRIRDAWQREQLLPGYAGRLLGVLAFGTMMSVAGRLILPVLLPRIVADLGITSGTAGFALTVMGAMTALATYPSGRLADQLSTKTILVVSIAFLTVGTIGFMGTSSYTAFLGAATVYGLGTGLYLPAAMIQISDLFTARRGQALGVNSASVNVGGVLVSFFAVPFIAATSWRTAFIPILFALLALFGAVHVLHSGQYRAVWPSFGIRATGRRLVANGRVRITLLAATTFSFAWHGVTGFLPTFLQLKKGFSEVLAGEVFALIFLVGIVINPVAGRVGDRWGYPLVISMAGLGGSVGVALVVLSSGLLPITAGVVLFGAGAAAFWPVLNSDIMGTLPEATRGSDYGAIRTTWTITGSVGPTYVGVLAAAADFVTAFAMLVPFLGVAVGVGLYLNRL